tara:strand:- start:26 stop:652 length:627 start_codon:yes stop_codon:yes gene_type:complete
MRHSVTFKLEKPNLAKWGLYTSLMPEVDSLCSDHGIIVEKRTCNIDTYEISEVIVATCQKRLFTAKHKVVELLQRNNIETTIVFLAALSTPVIQKSVTNWRIQELHQTTPNMDRWVACMVKIDQYAKSYGIDIHRIINRKTFSCAVSYDYIEDHHPELIAFYAGQVLAQTNIYLDHNDCHETAENILTDNLFDELSTTTAQHRQLSLL